MEIHQKGSCMVAHTRPSSITTFLGSGSKRNSPHLAEVLPARGHVSNDCQLEQRGNVVAQQETPHLGLPLQPAGVGRRRLGGLSAHCLSTTQKE